MPRSLRSKGRGLPRNLNRKPLLLTLAAAFLFTPPLHAQGCAQCLDSTRATPPQVQTAYRHAIYLLGGTGTLLFIAGTLLLRSKR